MLKDNITTLRKQKGYTQEMLAQQLNVVRQTISKWEKGLSVPDAEMLSHMAELFEVPVATLLGETVAQDPATDEVAKQLAVLNEQLASQAVRRRTLIKRIIIALIAIPLTILIIYMALFILFKAKHTAGPMTHTEMQCIVDGETYEYGITYDQNYQIHAEGGDEWIADHILAENDYDDANVLMAHIEDYVEEHGGTFKVVEQKTETE